MIVKNYYTAYDAYHANLTVSGGMKTPTTYTFSAAATNSYNTLRLGYYMTNVATAYGDTGIILGDGDTPVAFEDYKLSGNVIKGITGTVAYSYERDSNGGMATALITVTNANADSITIKEIGLCSVNNNYAVMVERTVLDSPLTIEAGGIGQITYRIRMNYVAA